MKPLLLCLAWIGPWVISPSVLALGLAFAVRSADDRLSITWGDQPVAEYVFRDPRILRPHFANLHAPDGVQVTRRHPPIAGVDSTDHDTMHPGVWLAFGDLNGQDFWRNKARIEHLRFTEAPRADDREVTFSTENRLVTTHGLTLGTQRSHVLITVFPQGYLLIWQATFQPAGEPLIFGDQEEMGLGVRMATAIAENRGGTLLANSGVSSAQATWGHSFTWCTATGMQEGRRVGVTLMPDPENFRPSWFHNRDYGLMVANPFGRKSMNQGETSRVVIQPEERLRLRFGVYLHATAAEVEPDIADAYCRFLAIQSNHRTD